MAPSFSPWFEDRPDRLEAELAALRNQGFKFSLDEQARSEGRIALSGKVQFGKRRIPIKIEYPDGFPYFKPLIFGPPQLLGRHQQPYTGDLCVWPSGEREWDWSQLGAAAYLLEEAIDLLDMATTDPGKLKTEEEQFPDPRNLYYPYHEGSHILLSSNMANIPDGAHGQVILLGPTRSTPQRGMIKRVRVDTPESYVVSAPKSWPRLFPDGGEIAGCWVKLSEPPPFLDSTDQFRRTIARWIAEQHPHPDQALAWSNTQFGWRGTNVRLLGVVFPDEKKWGQAPQDHWLFVLQWQELSPISDTPLEKTIIFRTEFLDETLWYERIPQLQDLASAQVAIFGLGALGSTIATSLTRAGVRRFLLLDHDYVEAGNLVRHESDISDLGTQKTRALSRRLSLINPDVEVAVAEANFGAGDTLRVLYSALDDYSLVISAMADDAANLVLNSLAMKLRIPQLHCWVGNGAWCGELLRVIPGTTACLECFFYKTADPSSQEAKMRPIESDEPLLRLANCTSSTFTGTPFDLATLANAAVRLSVQTLLRASPDSYPDAPYDYAAWQFRKGDADPLPAAQFGTVTHDARCSTCHGGR